MRRVMMLLGLLASVPAAAQTMYRGYDVGPDFGAMLERAQGEGAQMSSKCSRPSSRPSRGPCRTRNARRITGLSYSAVGKCRS